MYIDILHKVYLYLLSIMTKVIDIVLYFLKNYPLKTKKDWCISTNPTV